MANPRHLQILIEVLPKPSGRRLWLEYKLINKSIDLTEADLTGRPLRDFNLSDINLSFADLSQADLTRADLADAQLQEAELCMACLRGATLDRANLRGANLQDAELHDSAADRADFSSARLCGANLTGADLTGADLRGADLRGAILKYASLAGARLAEADVADADMTGAVLDDDAPAQLRNFDKACIDDRKYRLARYRRLNRPAVVTGGAEDSPAIIQAAQAETQTAIPKAKSARRPSDRLRSQGRKPATLEAHIPIRDVEPDLSTTEGCCQVLEIATDASRLEVVRAFRQKAKIFHPDKVRHLSPRLQELAAEEFVRLQQAYERLVRGATRPLTGVRWAQGVPQRASVYDYTIEDYQRLAQVNPDNANVLYNLAWKYFEAGRIQEALTGFQRVLALAPGDDDAQYNVMICRLCIEFEVAPPNALEFDDITFR